MTRHPIKKTFIQDLLDKCIEYLSSLAWRSFVNWLRNLPIVTKLLVFLPFLFALLVDFGFLQENTLLLDWYRIRNGYEFWRLITPFFYAGSFQSSQLLPHLFFMQHHCSNYERKPYDTGGGGGSADFLWMIILSMVFLTFAAGMLESQFAIQNTNQTLLYVVLYVWSKRMTDTFTIFGYNVVPTYLPMIRIVYDLLGILSAGGNIISPLLGIAFGHMYIWMVVEAPHKFRTRIIVTPKAVTYLLSLYASSQVTVIGGNKGATSHPTNIPTATVVAVSSADTTPAATGTVVGVSLTSTAPPAPKSMMSSLFGGSSGGAKSAPIVQGVAVPVNIAMKGWVHKQTKWMKVWKRRYLVLENKTLRVSDSETKEGTVLVKYPEFILKAVVACDMKHKPHVMSIMTAEGEFLLQCATAEERGAWIAAIKTLIP